MRPGTQRSWGLCGARRARQIKDGALPPVTPEKVPTLSSIQPRGEVFRKTRENTFERYQTVLVPRINDKCQSRLGYQSPSPCPDWSGTRGKGGRGHFLVIRLRQRLRRNGAQDTPQLAAGNFICHCWALLWREAFPPGRPFSLWLESVLSTWRKCRSMLPRCGRIALASHNRSPGR